MRHNSLLLVLVFLIMCLSCTSDVAVDGGSSSEVIASVSGKVFTENGEVIEGVSVALISSDYNPVSDTGIEVATGNTDKEGFFSLDSIRQGLYNLYALNPQDSTSLLDMGISIESDEVMVSDNHLKKQGAVTVRLPSNTDTATGVIALQGTLLKWPVQNVFEMSDGSLAMTLNSVPAGMLPSIKYIESQTGEITTIADSVSIEEGDTVRAGIDAQAKPVWTIPLIVGITDSTVQYFGGIDSVTGRLDDYITAINNKFNEPQVFNGILNFRADSVYSFSTLCSLEINTPYPDDFKLRLIMDGFSDDDIGYWSNTNRTAYEAAGIDEFFGSISVSAIAWQFGLSRGCIPSSYMLVSESGNPVSNTAFTGEPDFMYYPYRETSWDTYNIYAVNFYGSEVVPANSPSIVRYPSSISILALSGSGIPVSGAEITLYGVKWNSNAVTDTLVDAVSDNSGLYTLQENPYHPNADGKVKYCNILIQAVKDSDTAFAWMPINEVGIAGFENPEQDFRKTLRFSE